jgi:hypothetical protein
MMATMSLAIALVVVLSGPAESTAFDGDLSARRAMLETQLEAEADAVRVWWSVWMGVYVTGIAFNGFGLPYERSEGLRMNSVFSVTKSIIGIVQLLSEYGVAGMVVWLAFDEPVGMAWAALSLAVGEVTIWSYPWGAVDALERYQRRYPSAPR